jgi:phage FluMu protein Com
MADDEPKGLPPVQRQPPSPGSSATRPTHCAKCDYELRVVSNYLGVHAHCDRCKEIYPVSSSARRKEPVMNLPRGLRKVTLVEPDWGKAIEDIGESGDPNTG